MKRTPVVPGSLVRPKRNMGVQLWKDVEYRQVPNGCWRACMRGMLSDLDALAIVVARPRWLGSGDTDREGAVLLYVPSRKLFAWTWGSYLVVA